MDREITQLENELLEMEMKYSNNIPIDVGDLIYKTKILRKLQLESAREEGLQAGLTIKEIKQKRMDAGIALPSLSAESEPGEIPRESKISAMAENPTFSTNPTMPAPPPQPVVATPPVVHPPLNQMPIYHQAVNPPKTSAIQEKIAELSELNLGKYVMAILAALLALTGTIILGALAWEHITNEMKAVATGILATLMIFFPLRHILLQETRQSNGFLTSLLGAGISIHYINALFMGVQWGMLSETALMLVLIGLILFTVFVSHKIQSNTLLLVSFLGNFFCFFLLYSDKLAILSLHIGLIFLFASTIFLLVYSLYNPWVAFPTKVISFVFSAIIINIAIFTVQNGNNLLKVNSSTAYPEIYQVDSPFFGGYLVIFLYSLFLGTIYGKIGNYLEEESDYNLKICYGIGLFLLFFTFSAHFYPVFYLLLALLLSTVVLNPEKSLVSVVSSPFVIFALVHLANFYHSDGLGGEFVFYYSLIIVGVLLYLLTFLRQSMGYSVSIIIYTMASWITYLIYFEGGFEFAMLAILFAGIFYQGYKDELYNPLFSTLQLASFIPFSLMLALYMENFTDIGYFYEYIFPVLLLVTMALSVASRYFTRLEENQHFFMLVLLIKLFTYVQMSRILWFDSLDLPILFLYSLAMLAGMCQIFYQLFMPEQQYPWDGEKIPLLLLALLGLVSWSAATPLGEFNFTSSILVLIMGCLSIYLGFRQEEGNLRQLGLGISILGVLKMVTVDVASTDGVIRVLALIVGAVLCYGISNVYNKITPTGAEKTSIPLENPEEPKNHSDMNP